MPPHARPQSLHTVGLTHVGTVRLPHESAPTAAALEAVPARAAAAAPTPAAHGPRPGPHRCAAQDCDQPPAVQWQRLQDTESDDTIAVFACTNHALDPDTATQVHHPDCAAPPACTCTPIPAAHPAS